MFLTLFLNKKNIGTHWYCLIVALPMSVAANVSIEEKKFGLKKYSEMELYFWKTFDRNIRKYCHFRN